MSRYAGTLCGIMSLMSGTPRFLSAAEAARLLRVSEAHLYRQLQAGKFPGIKIASRWVVPSLVLDKMEADAINDWTVVDAEQYVVDRAR